MLAFAGIVVTVLVGALGYLAHQVVELRATVERQGKRIDALTAAVQWQNTMVNKWLVPPSERMRLH